MWEIVAKIFISLNLLTIPTNYLPVISLNTINNQETVSITKQQLAVANRLPSKINNESYGVKINAKSAAVIDKTTGAVLWQKNADEVRSIASITKLMTALVFLDQNPDWQKVITIESADEAYGDTPEILVTEQVTVKNLFYAAMIASDNNAAQALVRSVGLSIEDFVKLMNQKAKDLGLNNTTFVSPTGLEDGNKSTALEVLRLAREALSRPDIQAAVQLPEYRFTAVSGKEHRIFSTNHLFNSYLSVKGGKTGYTEAAGYCFVSEIANQQDDRIIVVVLDSDSQEGRFQDLKILATWILDNFSWS